MGTIRWVTEATERTADGEARRVRVIEQLDALAALGDASLDRVTRLAASMTGSRHAAIHVIDDATQHRLAAVGAPLEPTPRPDTLCRVVIETGAAVLAPDATLDERFAGSSFVTGPTPVRFYASHPLFAAGHDAPIGTLCVWDLEPRPDVTPAQVAALDDLAGIAVEHLESLRIGRLFAEQAVTDSLTGLANRRMLIDVLARAVEARAQQGALATMAVLDLDGFKHVNDEHGHGAGDAVLTTVAHRLVAAVPSGSLCARLGGDEFAIVLPIDVTDAAKVVERVRGAISAPMRHEPGGGGAAVELAIGATIGLAEVGPEDQVDEVLRRADLEMYTGKVRTRGR